MIISKLILKNYRKFEDKQLTFTKGINVVIGNNEAGKSTIFQAILDALYLDPTSKSEKVLEKISRWKSNKLPYLEIEFIQDIYKFRLVKDFQKKEAYLLNIDTNEKEESISEINREIAKMTGFATKEVYKNTSYISHTDVAKIEKNRDLINALQNVVNESSRDVNVQNLIYSIDKQIKSIRSGLDRTVKDPGPISVSRDRVEFLQSKIVEVKKALEDLKSAKNEGNKAHYELIDITKKIKDLETLIENNNKLTETSKRFKELDALILQIEADLNAYNELSTKKNFAERNLKQYSKFLEFDYEIASNELNNAIELRKIANSELSRFSIIDEDEDRDQSRLSFKIFIYLVGIVFSGFLFIVSGSLSLFFVAILITSTFISMYFYWRERYTINQAQKQKNLIEQQRDQWRYRIQDASEQIQKILDTFQCENPSVFFTSKARFIIERQEVKEIEDQIRGLLNGRRIEDLRSRQNELLLEKKTISTETMNDIMIKDRLSTSEYYSKVREIEDLKKRKAELEKIATVSEVRVEDGKISNEDLIQLEEDLETEQGILKRYERKLNILNLVKEGIEKSLQSTTRTMHDIIVQGMGNKLGIITFDRYKKFRLDDELNIWVYSNEKDDWIKPEESLSKGTIDQIYFLIRLIYSKSINKKDPAPVICDDIFVTFDEARLVQARTILEQESTDRQVLLFTCDSQYADWGMLIG